MKTCSNCGKEIEPAAKFCTSCGTPADGNAKSSVAEGVHPGHQDASVPSNVEQSPGQSDPGATIRTVGLVICVLLFIGGIVAVAAGRADIKVIESGRAYASFATKLSSIREKAFGQFLCAVAGTILLPMLSFAAWATSKSRCQQAKRALSGDPGAVSVRFSAAELLGSVKGWATWWNVSAFLSVAGTIFALWNALYPEAFSTPTDGGESIAKAVADGFKSGVWEATVGQTCMVIGCGSVVAVLSFIWAACLKNRAEDAEELARKLKLPGCRGDAAASAFSPSAVSIVSNGSNVLVPKIAAALLVAFGVLSLFSLFGNLSAVVERTEVTGIFAWIVSGLAAIGFGICCFTRKTGMAQASASVMAVAEVLGLAVLMCSIFDTWIFDTLYLCSFLPMVVSMGMLGFVATPKIVETVSRTVDQSKTDEPPLISGAIRPMAIVALCLLIGSGVLQVVCLVLEVRGVPIQLLGTSGILFLVCGVLFAVGMAGFGICCLSHKAGAAKWCSLFATSCYALKNGVSGMVGNIHGVSGMVGNILLTIAVGMLGFWSASWIVHVLSRSSGKKN